MKLRTRFYIVILVVILGFGSLAGLSTFFTYKINRLKKANTICFDTLETLKNLQIFNAELLYSVELDKTWANWKVSHGKLQEVLEILNESGYIRELMMTPEQEALLQSLYLFWLSTREKLTLVEHAMEGLFRKKGISRDGLIQQYYTTKNYEVLAIRNRIMDGSLYLRADFEVKLAKLVSIIEEETEKQFFRTLVLLAIISSAIAIVVSTILISFLAILKRYLAELHRTMKIIGKGNFSEKLSVEGDDELSQISMAINMTTYNLGAIHQELEARIIEAESANLSKSLFLANMSHELRTPLNAILGFSRLIAQTNNLDAEQKKSLSIISRSGEHLLSMINDILTMSKIEAGGLVLNEQRFDLYSLLDDLKEMFRLKAQKKEIDFKLIRDDSLPRTVITDEVKLRQILINLIQNGLKFTVKGDVSLGVYRKKNSSSGDENQLIQFEVKDTGIGIAKNNHDHIFEVFAQVDPSRERQGGVGLGLPLSRRYVELMKGALTVESEIGKGAAFTFAIPVKVTGQPDAGTQETQRGTTGVQGSASGMSMLMADDTGDNRRLLVNQNDRKPDLAGLNRPEDSVIQDFFSDVPEQILTDLEQAVVRAEMDNIFNSIKEIEPFNHELATIFSQLANEFAYDSINNLLANRKAD
jgi:signal transduction histidine kinase